MPTTTPRGNQDDLNNSLIRAAIDTTIARMGQPLLDQGASIDATDQHGTHLYHIARH